MPQGICGKLTYKPSPRYPGTFELWLPALRHLDSRNAERQIRKCSFENGGKLFHIDLVIVSIF